MKLNIPPQIPRLVVAFAVFVLLFLLARHFLRPKSFGEYGHYRGAALEEIAAQSVNYAGQQACFDCHPDIEDMKSQDVHSEIHCETCHGPGLRHTEKGDTAFIIKPVSREFCGLCHSKNAARKTDAVYQVDLNEHNVGKNCIECHNPHQPWNMKEE